MNTGRVLEGPDDNFTLLIPKYDVNQSLGPNNEASAYKEWQRKRWA